MEPKPADGDRPSTQLFSMAFLILGAAADSEAAGSHLRLPALSADQPVEAARLERDEGGNLERFGDLCERGATVVTSGAARGQEVSSQMIQVIWRRPTTTTAVRKAWASEGRRKDLR
jgi:hypothetical protein